MRFLVTLFSTQSGELLALIEADYAWITHQLNEVAARHSKGRIVSMLEGGYHLSALGRSAVAHVRALSEAPA